MSKFPRGGRQNGRNFQGRELANSAPRPGSRGPLLNRNGPPPRFSPWEPGIAPGNRPSALLPTPTQGLLQPSMTDVQLAVASNVLNLLLPQHQNQIQPLLNLNTNRGGLLPLTPPINPFHKSNFGTPGLQDSRGSGSRIPPGAQGQGPNRPRPGMQGRRLEPYKMGNRNQRPEHKNDDRKIGSSLPSSAGRSGTANKQTSETGDDREKKTSESAGKEPKEDKDDALAKAYADIPSDMFKCHVCSKSMWDSTSFLNHLKGKAHQNMMERREESYKIETEMKRHELKVDEQQRQIAFERKHRQGKAKGSQQPHEYCTMCNLHFNGNLTSHRKSSKHQQLKSFLHPKCEICSKEFATRIEWDQHQLSAGHLKTSASKRAGKEVNSISNTLKRPIEAEESPAKRLKQDEAACSSNTEIEKTDDQPKNTVESVKSEPQEDVTTKSAMKSSGETSLNLQSSTILQPTIMEEGSSQASEVIPPYDSQREIGTDMLQEKTGYLCKCCNRFLSSSSDAKTHCRSQFHYDKYVTFMKNSVKPAVVPSKAGATSAASATKEQVEKQTTQSEQVKEDDVKDQGKMEDVVGEVEPKDSTNLKKDEVEEEEEDEDEGNWKRRKISKDNETVNLQENANTSVLETNVVAENQVAAAIPKTDVSAAAEISQDSTPLGTNGELQDKIDNSNKSPASKEPSAQTARRGRRGATRGVCRPRGNKRN